MKTTAKLPSVCTDETNGLHYTLVGDYYLPNLTIEEESYTPQIWARRRLNYLKC